MCSNWFIYTFAGEQYRGEKSTSICKIIRQNVEGGWTNHLSVGFKQTTQIWTGSWQVDEQCFRAIELPLKKKNFNKRSCFSHDRRVCSDNYSCVENNSYF